MKRIGLLLILISLFMAACSSGGTAVDEPVENEEQAAPTTIEPLEESDVEVENTAVSSTNDPTQARDRDWKLGNTTTPAVTIIEYGDFQ